jgi:imidazolonepropionase-like amidohydrolase
MHGNVMTDEGIEKLIENDVTLVPTLLLLANLADWPQLTGAPYPQYHGARRMLEKSVDSLHRAREAGVKFAMGTDSGFAVTPYGEWHARELELLRVYAGLSNMEAILAATANGAKMLNLEGKLGKLLPGYLADVIVVKGNPARDLHVLVDKRNVEIVIKDGVVQEFPDDLDMVRYHHDRDPLIYSQTELTYDMVTGDNPEKPYSVLPWSMSDGLEIAHEIDRSQQALVPEDGAVHD